MHKILTDIAQGEDQRREFKREVDNPESMAGEIVAFANSEGGTLYLGVNDDGSIFGVGNVETAFQTLTNICQDRCIPPVSPIIEQIALDRGYILSLKVASELNRLKPYRTAGGRFYIRVGKDKKDATGRELMRIAQAAGEMHYDESPVVGAGLSELSLPVFSAYHEKQFGVSLDEQLAESGLDLVALLRNMRLSQNIDGEEMLTVAAVLIFGAAPQRFLPQSRLSAVAFSGANEDSDILDRREITGRLPDILSDAKLFLERNIRMPAREQGFHREDIELYDRKALGEALVNAIAHRDYSLSGSQIRLFIFSDRIEVRSPGRLPNSITLENIRLGVHAERNRAIATLLTQLGLMSAIGTGIPRLIIRLSRLCSGREPSFEYVGEELRVRIMAKCIV
ncbi:MAG: putative DNA binding domain-containing protein [Candidatus Sumerlaeota bacterium]|nr:putative DNA binding domain-containing protein [Candidatus Sumerlaeota bacterium]